MDRNRLISITESGQDMGEIDTVKLLEPKKGVWIVNAVYTPKLEQQCISGQSKKGFSQTNYRPEGQNSGFSERAGSPKLHIGDCPPDLLISSFNGNKKARPTGPKVPDHFL